MECAGCHASNDPPRRFCRRCGRRLDTCCPRCGFANGRADDYCGGCGAGLGDAPAARPSADEDRTASMPSKDGAPAGVIDEILGGAGPGTAPGREDDADGPLTQEAIDKLFRRGPGSPDGPGG